MLTCEDGIWARRIVFAVALEKILNLEGLGLLAFTCKAVSQNRSRALYRKRKLKYMLFKAVESFCNIRVCAIFIPRSRLELSLLARFGEQNSVS